MVNFHSKTIYQALGRESVHPFPARMAAGIALQAMSDTTESIRVLDPMMGSGTVLAMARSQGHRGIGFDIDPLAVLISKVWTTAWDLREVRENANDVLGRARAIFRTLPRGEAYPSNADDETCVFSRYWFDDYARRQLASLSRAIAAVDCQSTRDALWCAFSRLIITKQYGASLAMDLSHSRPHRAFERAQAKPFRRFLSSVERVLVNVIDKKSPSRGPAPSIRLGDARNLPLDSGSVDLVLTSPPYLNAIDYFRCSKFSLVWMGHSIAELRKLRANAVGTEAGSDSTLDDDKVQWILDALNVRPSMGQRHQRILGRYINDMHGAIREVARVLSRAGKAVYVVGENTLRGTYIRTSVLVSKLAEVSGLNLQERRNRALPGNRRYLPPPNSSHSLEAMNVRMRREVVLTFAK
jgi:DNA modification methylase